MLQKCDTCIELRDSWPQMSAICEECGQTHVRLIRAYADISALTPKQRWYDGIGIGICFTGRSLSGDWIERPRPILTAAATGCFLIGGQRFFDRCPRKVLRRIAASLLKNLLPYIL